MKKIKQEFLKKEYLLYNQNISQIAKKIGCSYITICRRLKKFNIHKTKSQQMKGVLHHSKWSDILTKDFLQKEYITKRKHSSQIAYSLNTNHKLIIYHLKKHNIPIRTKSEAKKGHTKNKKWRTAISASKKIFYKNHPNFFKGKKNPNYINGKGNEPYTLNFDDKLKESIRKRDNYICQKCGVPQLECIEKLSVHHIDYNKENCEEDNLISLCHRCNVQVNYNRDYWKKHFKKLIKNAIS